MQRFFALLQLLLLTLPAFASVRSFGNAEANLPACCRRAGAHHCAMPTGAPPQAQDSTLPAGSSVAAKPRPCPFCPKAMPSAQDTAASLSPSAAFFADIVSHPAVAAQTLAKFRVARDRARQKRGPPQRA